MKFFLKLISYFLNTVCKLFVDSLETVHYYLKFFDIYVRVKRKHMKLFNTAVVKDFGVERIISFLQTESRSALQISLSWNDYNGFPYLQISFGSNNLASILFWCGKFGFSLDLFGYTWRDLKNE